MTEAEFRAMPIKQQNEEVALALGREAIARALHNWSDAELAQSTFGRYVNGGWAEFGEMFDAYRVVQCPLSGENYDDYGYALVNIGTDILGDDHHPNLAVALALLKAKGVIEE